MSGYNDLASLGLTTRPIDSWPGALTDESARTATPFTASFTDTVDLLARELDHLDAERIVLQLAIAENRIRNDGLPYADARANHPGVVLAFDSTHGPLKYATDAFTGRGGWGGYLGGWQSNLRAIALGLEALRKVDRYGITKRGEQYTGWKALPAGIPMGSGATHLTSDEALELIIDATRDTHGVPRWVPAELRGDARLIRCAYKRAALKLHPDVPGGSTEDFQRLQAARDLLLREAS